MPDTALTPLRNGPAMTRLCRWLTGHHVDALTGRCHLCRGQVLDPIKD